MPDRLQWSATSAWRDTSQSESAPEDPPHLRDLSVDLLEFAEAATIIVCAGQDAELARRVRATCESDLPAAGRTELGKGVDFIWSAPGQWLAIAKDGRSLADLSQALAGIAAVTAQGDSRAMVRISGARARDFLARGVAVDLHPSVFRTGYTAVTKIAHVSVQFWQIDEMPTYMMAVPRSFAGSIRSWIEAARAPFASPST